MKKLDALTTTRFFAALTVIFFHGGKKFFPLNTYPITPLFTSGSVFVSYFFVLSGFILAYVYYRPREKFNLGHFWSARFARIYPVYLFSFGLIILHYIDVITTTKSAKIWSNLLLVQAWIPKYALSFNVAAWSLSVEAFFYIAFPFLMLWAYRQSLRRMSIASLLFWLLSQVVHIYLVNKMGTESHNFLYYNPLFHLNAFLIGTVGGIWYQTKAESQFIQPKRNRGAFLLSVLLTGGTMLWDYHLAKSGGASIHLPLVNGLLAPFFLITIISLALDKTNLSKALSHPFLVLLGEASYALYIVHVPFYLLYKNFLKGNAFKVSDAVLYYSYVLFVIGFSILVHKWIEKPTRTWLRDEFKKGLQNSSILLITGNGLAIFFAVKLSFWLRLGDISQVKFYTPAVTLMLLSTLIVRLPLFHAAKKERLWHLLVQNALGSLLITGLMFTSQALGWIEGFPKSVLLLEYLLYSGIAGLLLYRAGLYSLSN